MKKLGLIAAEGEMPPAFVASARAKGYRVVVLALRGLADKTIAEQADEVRWFKPGQLGGIISFLKQESITEVLAAGKIPKSILFKGALSADLRLIKFLFRLKNRGDESIMNSLAAEFESEGISILDMREFCTEMMATVGVMTKRPPAKRERDDIDYGFKVAKEIGRLDIGQTVVVKDKAVIAVEAIEGTDEAIRRGGALSGGGASVVKVSRPGQDMRFDVPVVGIRTLGVMKLAGIKALGIEAGGSLLIDKDEFLAEADRQGISVVGLKGDSKEDALAAGDESEGDPAAT